MKMCFLHVPESSMPCFPPNHPSESPLEHRVFPKVKMQSICLAVAPSDTAVLKIQSNSPEICRPKCTVIINCNQICISSLEHRFFSKVKINSICPVEVYSDTAALRSTTISTEVTQICINLPNRHDCQHSLYAMSSMEHRLFLKVKKYSICPAVAILDTAVRVKSISSSAGQNTISSSKPAQVGDPKCRLMNGTLEAQQLENRSGSFITNNTILVANYGRTQNPQVSVFTNKHVDYYGEIVSITAVHTSDVDKCQRLRTQARAQFSARVNSVKLAPFLKYRNG